MTNIDEVIAGLQIFSVKGGNGAYIAAEHDEIFAGNEEDFTAEEIAQLDEWGWRLTEYGNFSKFV